MVSENWFYKIAAVLILFMFMISIVVCTILGVTAMFIGMAFMFIATGFSKLTDWLHKAM